MATTRARADTSAGFLGFGWWLIIGIALAASLAILTTITIRGGESSEAVAADTYTMVKVNQVESLGGGVVVAPTRTGYSEYKLDQIADLGFGGGAIAVFSETYTRFKLDQVRGDSVAVPVPPNLVE